MDYKVIVVSDNNEIDAGRRLENRVKLDIRDGWKPLGGVSVSRSDFGNFQKTVVAQAMIKE